MLYVCLLGSPGNIPICFKCFCEQRHGTESRKHVKTPACSDLSVDSYLAVIGILTRLLQSSLIKFPLEHIMVSCIFYSSEMCSKKKWFGMCQRCYFSSYRSFIVLQILTVQL